MLRTTLLAASAVLVLAACQLSADGNNVTTGNYATYARNDAQCRASGDAGACAEAERQQSLAADRGIVWRPSQSVYAPPKYAPDADTSSQVSTGHSEIALRRDGGTFTVPVSINSAITLQFTLDSGAADVSIPADVVLTLMRTGTIDRSDFLGSRNYVLADGSTAPSTTFRIRSLRVGNHEVRNVTGSIAPVKGGLLLGQSFLRQFGSWSIDNRRGVLVLD